MSFVNRLTRRLLAPPDPLGSFRRLVDQADAANARRDWPVAEAGYAATLRIDPLRDDMWVQYGHMLKEQGKVAEAERAYATAAERMPAFPDAVLHLAHLRARSGRAPAPVAPSPPLFYDVDELPVRSAEHVFRPAGSAARDWPTVLRALPGRLAPGRAKEPIVFLHLHKTGGLTLDDILAAHFSPARICPLKDDHLHVYDRASLDRFDFFSGHFDVGALRLLRPARTVSLFREPRARLVSFYRFHAGHALGGKHGVNEFAQMANAMGPEAFFEDERVRRAPEIFNHYLAVFGLTYSQLNAAASVSVDRVSEAVVARAIARVRGLDAIGLLERFDQSVQLTCARFGLTPPAAVKPRNETDVLARRMKGTSPPAVAMTPRLAAALADLVRFDEPIYAAAKAEFEARWQRFVTEGHDARRP